jgi:drug/metabolite transporter (DMT)-like permease
MTALIVTLWSLNIVLDTSGQLAFKRAALDASSGEGLARWRRMATRPWLWTGIGCFAAEFLCWLAFLSLVPLSRGVLLGSFNIVAIMLAGRILFGERLSQWRVAGIVLIGMGVAAVGLG